MPPDPLLDVEEDDYASSEDSDFAPEAAAAEEEEVESNLSEDEAADEAAADTQTPATATAAAPSTTTKRKRKQAGGQEEAEDAGFENSGDEAIIGRGKKRLKRGRQNALEDEEGGEGGLIKTRSQRAAEKEEKKYAKVQGPVTIDVDKIWREMVEGEPTKVQDMEKDKDDVTVLESPSKSATQPQPEGAAQATTDPNAMVRIKRTYNFAGKVHTEEKLVARDSAEAKLYFASLGLDAPPGTTDAADDQQQPVKRLPRKAFRSAFEPVFSDNLPKRSDLNLGMGVLREAREAATRAEAKKLNTVEKSRMDWAGYVDKEGIKDELELAGKSKTSFVGRQDFLARSEARREEEARRARLAGKV
ncbi:bucentaur or craniofacial development-domain-containing protein [Coniochaeta sp. 2T2.1]|nr:bucentaur or craniofacial development-domain-containing protein [Coniochaeta sp. 2T2.1]